jgi:hypothetical protein
MNKLLLSFGTAAIAAMLAGCADSALVPAQTAPMPQYVAPAANTPPACKGQKTTKEYATVTEPLSSKGAYLCIPRFGNFGGTIASPGLSPSAKVALTSSTTNYANVPLPRTGSPVFYLNLTPSGGTKFGTALKSGGGLTGKGVKAKATYSAFLDGYRFGFWYAVTSCYAVAGSGKDGGVVGGIGSLLKGQGVGGESGYTAFEVFVYEGQDSGSKC